MKYSFAMKKKKILPLTTWMTLRGRHSAQQNKPDRRRQIQYDLTYTWNLQKQKSNSQKQRIKWWSSEAGEGGEWRDVGQRVQSYNYVG